jgi:hypothetical protein
VHEVPTWTTHTCACNWSLATSITHPACHRLQARSDPDPWVRLYARLGLAGLPRGGGNGDDIRMGILHIMRDGGIKEGHRPVSIDGAGRGQVSPPGCVWAAARSRDSALSHVALSTTSRTHAHTHRATTSPSWSSGTRSCTKTRRPRT